MLVSLQIVQYITTNNEMTNSLGVKSSSALELSLARGEAALVVVVKIEKATEESHKLILSYARAAAELEVRDGSRVTESCKRLGRE